MSDTAAQPSSNSRALTAPPAFAGERGHRLETAGFLTEILVYLRERVVMRHTCETALGIVDACYQTLATACLGLNARQGFGSLGLLASECVRQTRSARPPWEGDKARRG